MYSTSEEAEDAFYEAFNKRNMRAMMDIWEKDDQVVCIHPMVDRVMGHENVKQIWDDIFDAAPAYTIEVKSRLCTLTQNLAIHVVHEHIIMENNDKPYPPMVATNIFRLTESGWFMILHHASPTSEVKLEEKEGQEGMPVLH